MPDFQLEMACPGPVCGVDEAGRGPWAGPVCAAAVILDPATAPAGLNDSKKLSHLKREALEKKKPSWQSIARPMAMLVRYPFIAPELLNYSIAENADFQVLSKPCYQPFKSNV